MTGIIVISLLLGIVLGWSLAMIAVRWFFKASSSSLPSGPVMTDRESGNKYPPPVNR